MIINFKMKFEHISSRETSLEHYRKRAIGWHGVQIMYFKFEDDKNNEDGIISKKPLPYTVCLDQMMDDGNRQDTARVWCHY